jgi:hypothetical protein
VDGGRRLLGCGVSRAFTLEERDPSATLSPSDSLGQASEWRTGGRVMAAGS